MARYGYDVNTTQRYIDVHKQFQGGLKTVDTDDALGAVFLRQAENVSLSEFGFIEKRYGTFENFKKQISGNLQGYWEFNGKIVYAVDGNFYIDDEKVTKYYISLANRYPEFSDIFTQGNFVQESGYIQITDGSAFQKTRDINGVSINGVLYIFTGTYPVYLVKDGNFFRFNLLPVQIPTYDEIVVTGHNLLENNYNDLYGFNTTNDYQLSGLGITTASNSILSSSYYPRIPYQQDGKINFQFTYSLDSSSYANPFEGNEGDRFYTIDLESVKYRNSGAGASNLDYITAEKPEFELKTNYQGTTDFLLKNGEPFFENQIVTAAETDYSYSVDSRERTELGTTYTEYWTNHKYRIRTSDNIEKVAFREFKNQTFVLKEKTTDPDQIYKPILLNELVSRIESATAITNGSTQTTYKIVITPYAEDGTLFENDKLVIPVSSITALSGVGYSYEVPDTLIDTENVYGYNVAFKGTITYKGTAAFFVPIANNRITALDIEFYKSLDSYTIISPPGTGNVLNNPNTYPSINFELTDLLTGLYDFEVTFALRKYSYINGFLDFNTEEDGTFLFSKTFYNVQITAEKLQDYPGVVDLPKLKPIWSCNKVVEHFGKLMVWGSTEMPTALFYSFPDRPGYFPSKFYLDFTNDENNEIESVSSFMNVLIVQTKDRTWGVRGNSGYIDSPSPYVPFTINPSVGTIAYKSVRPVQNKLFFLSKQGVVSLNSLYAVDEMYNIKFEDLNIRNIVPQDSKAVGIQFDNQYWLNFPNYGITLRWYIDKKAWVLDKYDAWESFTGVFKYQIVNGKLEFISYPSRFLSTQNLAIYKIGIDYSLPTDLGSPIQAKLETSYLNQNYPFHPKNYKEAKLDFTLQNEYNLGRTPIYEMETNEDISGSVHTIPNTLIPNHRYRLEYDFTETTNTVIDGGSFTSSVFEDTLDGGAGYEGATEFLDLLYYTAVASITLDGVYPQLFYVDYQTTDFLLPADLNGATELIIVGDFTGYEGGAYLRDVTYDDSLVFNTWVMSEEQTLNLDNYQGYDPALQDVGLNLSLKDRLGDWVFGTSDFGNKVTAVKTIKLSGRGYNSKIYLEDYSKSKWTLESIGLTYKMKRARSR